MSMFDNEEREQRVAKEEEKGFPRKKKVRRRSGLLPLIVKKSAEREKKVPCSLVNLHLLSINKRRTN
ncbi:hypothetical protein YC2023_039976 [Brassica napus]